MEANQMSFSIGNWKRQELKSITKIQQQMLFASTPYNLNDFKQEHPKNASIFLGEQVGQAKRQFNNKYQLEIGLFVVFLLEVIQLSNGERASCLQRLRSYIHKIDICRLKEIPDEWKSYYKNELIKKVLLQYLGKCQFNTSLIEILLSNNQFLQFAISLLLKTILKESGKIDNFQDKTSFQALIQFMLPFMNAICIQEHTHNHIFSLQNKFILKSQHYLLVKQKHKIYLYKLQTQTEELPEDVQPVTQQRFTRQEPQTQQIKVEKGQQKKQEQNGKSKKKKTTQCQKTKKHKQNNFWDCLCYLCPR